jgi:UDP-N-acetylmuramate dehydrogenase
MIRHYKNYPLKTHNTFGIDVKADEYFEFTEVTDLEDFFASITNLEEQNLLILGGGSNILFTGDYHGLILRPNIPGIAVIEENRQSIWIEAGAGEIWDELIHYCVVCGFGGMENLSDIPGSVGAAPIQNIGAYGQELADVVERVNGFDLLTGKKVSLSAVECGFGYRNSVFKTGFRTRIIITSVVFRLEKFPEFKIDYGNIRELVLNKGGINLINIRESIIETRAAKLPDYHILGNAGSFFKNPVIDIEKADSLRIKYADVPLYPAENGLFKTAAGWLIEKAGWKGYREGHAGVHEKQALVLVNYGKATGTQMLALSQKITDSVLEKFGIRLEKEVNVV